MAVSSVDRELSYSPSRHGLLHIHVPKTAGTTLRRAFADTYGPANVLFYEPSIGMALPSDRRFIATEQDTATNGLRAAIGSSRIAPLLRPIFRGIRNSHDQRFAIDPAMLEANGFDVLSGHFEGRHVKKWGRVGNPTVTVVRDPLDRTFSHYKHWQRSGGQLWTGHQSRMPLDVDFETWALKDSAMDNFQTKWLGGIPLTHVGVDDKLPDLYDELGLQAPEAVRLNTGTYDRDRVFDSGFIVDFVSQNAADYELYNKARDHWDQ